MKMTGLGLVYEYCRRRAYNALFNEHADPLLVEQRYYTGAYDAYRAIMKYIDNMEDKDETTK